MTTFEYLAVLVSVIVGLGITQLLGGVARIVTHRTEYKLYWVHLLWTFNTFAGLIYWWWFQLWMDTVEEWTYPLYTFLILYSVLVYLECAIIIPSDFPKDGGFREYFFSRRGWFFAVTIGYLLVDLVDTLMKDHELVLVAYLAGFALMGIAIATKNARFHGFFAVLIAVETVVLMLSGFWIGTLAT